MIDECGIEHIAKSHGAGDDSRQSNASASPARRGSRPPAGWIGPVSNATSSSRCRSTASTAPSKSASSASRYGGAWLSEELSGHPDWSFYGSTFGKYGLLAQRDRVFKRHSKTTPGAAHILENSENLANGTSILVANPNVLADISARVSESGRQHIGTSAKTRRVQ